MSQLTDRIENDFRYHKPSAEGVATIERFRAEGRSLAHLVAQLCPPGREQSTAIMKIEEAIMWANAGVARQYDAEEA